MHILSIKPLPPSLETLSPCAEVLLHISQEEMARINPSEFKEAANEYRIMGGLTTLPVDKPDLKTVLPPPEIYSIAGKGMVLLGQVLAAGIISKTLHAVFQAGNISKKMIVSFESEDEARTELAKLTSMVEAWHQNRS